MKKAEGITKIIAKLQQYHTSLKENYFVWFNKNSHRLKALKNIFKHNCVQLFFSFPGFLTNRHLKVIQLYLLYQNLAIWNLLKLDRAIKTV